MNFDEYEKALKELEAKISLIKSGYIPCDHPSRQGDNYGESCLICGERTAGFGYWGSHNDCLHQFVSMGPQSTYEICMYCEQTRNKIDDGSAPQSG